MPCYSVSPAYRRNIVHVNPFFNPYYQAPQAVFRPRYSVPALFRSFEEDLAQFDNFFKEVDAGLKSAVAAQKKVFQPKFDIKEDSDKYVLNGELPGVQPENLSIEFVDKNIMVVKGKVVRTETHGTPPAAQTSEPAQIEQSQSVEQQPQQDVSMSGALPDNASETASISSASNYQKASVEEEEGVAENPTSSAPAEEAQVEKTTAPQQQEVSKPAAEEHSHYWVNERTIGEFSRTFRFPGKVNQDAVHASLMDGVLTVSVPKQAPEEIRRKIEVQGA